MNVLVTGAGGFIGNYVIKELLRNGHTVIASDISNTKIVDRDWADNVTFIECDISKLPKDVFKLFKQPELMIHLAWHGLPKYKELHHFEETLVYNYFFLKQMLQSGLKDISVTGTCLEYGMQEGELSESLLTNPNNSYAIAKDTLRKFIEELQRKLNFDFKWIRLFYMYGEGQSQNSILSQLQKAIDANEPVFNMSKGEQERDYLPVEKVAEYIVAIATQKKVQGVINCSSGTKVRIKDLVNNYLQKTNQSIKLNLGYYPYPDYEPMSFWGRNNKLNSILGKHEKY
jgi:dTDP-6-deoxy-L-talose 4-dehydrogenase (NAD+)